TTPSERVSSDAVISQDIRRSNTVGEHPYWCQQHDDAVCPLPHSFIKRGSSRFLPPGSARVGFGPRRQRGTFPLGLTWQHENTGMRLMGQERDDARPPAQGSRRGECSYRCATRSIPAHCASATCCTWASWWTAWCSWASCRAAARR